MLIQCLKVYLKMSFATWSVTILSELTVLYPNHTGLVNTQRQHFGKSCKKLTPYHRDFAVISLCILSTFAFIVVVSHDYTMLSQEAKKCLECSKVVTATNLSQCFCSTFALHLHALQCYRCDCACIRKTVAMTLTHCFCIRA